MSKSEAKIARLNRLGRVCTLVMACTVASCAHEPGGPRLPEPLKLEKAASPDRLTLMPANTSNKRSEMTITPGPAVPEELYLADPISNSAPPKLTGENLGVNFEGIKLPTFVNTVFGELLKVTFEIDNSVLKQERLVTLRTSEPIPPNQFYELVVQTLANYNLAVAYQNNVYRIIDASTARKDIPQIVRSRTLPNVPGDQRPVFFFTVLKNVQSPSMQVWLEMALKDRVTVSGIANTNGILLIGKRDDINAALDTIEILDQPAMAGSRSLKLSPAFWGAMKLSEQLVNILSAEGYSAGIGASTLAAIKFIPIEALNTIVVFSVNDTTLQHVLRWAGDLDQPSQALTVNTQGIYYYQVQNASAKKLADLIGQILGADSGNGGSPVSQQTASGIATASQTSQTNQAAQPKLVTGRQRVLVDETRNALIFQGSAEEYAQFRTLVEKMDLAPLEVLIEATVAEVTLDQNENLGVILGYDDRAATAANKMTVRSDTGLIATLLRSNGKISASLNSLASNSRITVLSTPRLATTSGNSASIQVGSQVPIITTQQTAANGAIGGTSNILQDVQYRNTGILLNIKPTINSSRRVELTISQEVSTAVANNISKVDSPVIQQRSIQTTLSLSDGETVLLGGLITDSFNSGDSGIPYLKDIPLIGNLFKNQSKSHTRQELIVLLTPYIVDGPEASRAVRDAFKMRLGEWAHTGIGATANDNARDAPMPNAVAPTPQSP